jgi:hypothetical protein
MKLNKPNIRYFIEPKEHSYCLVPQERYFEYFVDENYIKIYAGGHVPYSVYYSKYPIKCALYYFLNNITDNPFKKVLYFEEIDKHKFDKLLFINEL